jgi:hypothetical protein
MTKEDIIQNNNGKVGALATFSIAIAIVLSLHSMSPWFFWDLTFGKGLLVAFYMVIGIPLMRKPDNTKIYAFIGAFIIFLFFYGQFGVIQIRESVSKVLNVLPIICIPFYSLSYKKAFLKWFIRVYSVILAVSLVTFALYMVGFNFPYTISRNMNEFYQPFTNYYSFLICVRRSRICRYD